MCGGTLIVIYWNAFCLCNIKESIVDPCQQWLSGLQSKVKENKVVWY